MGGIEGHEDEPVMIDDPACSLPKEPWEPGYDPSSDPVLHPWDYPHDDGPTIGPAPVDEHGEPIHPDPPVGPEIPDGDDPWGRGPYGIESPYEAAD
jgi:hypothetical protein